MRTFTAPSALASCEAATESEPSITAASTGNPDSAAVAMNEHALWKAFWGESNPQDG